jgi:hypothetical protein
MRACTRRLRGLKQVSAYDSAARLYCFFSLKGLFMKYLTICLSIVFATLITACAPTETSRGTGQFVDDAAVTTRVKTQLAKTAGLGEALAINVDTYRGVVSLSGFVDNTDQMQTATRVARSVPGVESVKNNLQIKPKAQ